MILDGDEFGRACFNAHSFLPARCPYKTALLRIRGDVLDVTATDGYAVGRATIHLSHASTTAVAMEVARDDLLALDKAARSAKGEVSLSVKAGDGLMLGFPYGGGIETAIMDAAGRYGTPAELWDACEDLLTRLDECPGRIAFDPGVLARFGKVKTIKGTSPMLDMAWGDGDAPVLCKIGPSFVGAIMPVDRGIASSADTRGSDFLW